MPKCPKCKSTDVKSTKSGYECQVCGHSWKAPKSFPGLGEAIPGRRRKRRKAAPASDSDLANQLKSWIKDNLGFSTRKVVEGSGEPGKVTLTAVVPKSKISGVLSDVTKKYKATQQGGRGLPGNSNYRWSSYVWTAKDLGSMRLNIDHLSSKATIQWFADQ